MEEASQGHNTGTACMRIKDACLLLLAAWLPLFATTLIIVDAVFFQRRVLVVLGTAFFGFQDRMRSIQEKIEQLEPVNPIEDTPCTSRHTPHLDGSKWVGQIPPLPLEFHQGRIDFHSPYLKNVFFSLVTFYFYFGASF
jgi:hypothetical protein